MTITNLFLIEGAATYTGGGGKPSSCIAIAGALILGYFSHILVSLGQYGYLDGVVFTAAEYGMHICDDMLPMINFN